MESRVRLTQLSLLGTLDAATVTITLHVADGVVQRHWWISAVDENDDQILLWSDSTAPGPHGGLNLAELLSQLLEITRLVRAGDDGS